MSSFTSGWAFWYAWAPGSRVESTQTVMVLPACCAAGLKPVVAPAAGAAAALFGVALAQAEASAARLPHVPHAPQQVPQRDVDDAQQVDRQLLGAVYLLTSGATGIRAAAGPVR